jgi:ATP-dependent DNA helicase RecG
MLEDAMSHIRRIIKIKTIVDAAGNRSDKFEYPLRAMREMVLNALIHRDYSDKTASAPIRIAFFSDRLEIENPGGLYGRMTLDQLGKTTADIRNPKLAAALEILIKTENRFSGVPIIRRDMREAGLPPPIFESFRGIFRVTLRNDEWKEDGCVLNEQSERDNKRLKAKAEKSKKLNLRSLFFGF